MVPEAGCAKTRVSGVEEQHCVQFHIHLKTGYEFADEHLLGREIRS